MPAPISLPSFCRRFLIRLILLFVVLSIPSVSVAVRTVRVGAFASEPFVFQSEDGKLRGFVVDILERIAELENWNLEYVYGTFPESVAALTEGRVDLLPALSYSRERAERFDFSVEPVSNDWARLFARTGSGIRSLLDLRGKTVLVRSDDVHATAFRKQMTRFGIPLRILRASTYEDLLKRLERGEGDAGVVNRMVSLRKGKPGGLEKTAIIFNPTDVLFATAPGRNTDLLSRLDIRLRKMKENPDSVFHTALERWLGVAEPAKAPRWVRWLALTGVGALVFVLSLNIVLRSQVRSRTAELSIRNRELFDEIAERQRKEDALRVATDHLRAIYDTSPDMVFLHDGETGRLLEVNDNVLTAYGVSKEEILSSPPGRFMGSGASFEGALEKIRKAASGEATDFQWLARRKDGVEFPVDVRLRRLEKRTGDRAEKVNVVAVVRDLTDQKQAENEKLELERQLQQSQKMESVGRLAGGVAHDFNNLLSSIIGYTELALLKTRDEKMREYLRTASAAGEQAASLTRGLLAFSRTQVLQVRVVKLNEVVVNMARMLGRILGEDIEVVTETEAEDARIEADRNQIEQVLMNLGANARDAMPEGGKLTIGTAAATFNRQKAAWLGDGLWPGRYVRLYVRDTGVGMDEKIQEKIFEPFFTTKGREYGTGLGLATTYGIVRQHNGHVRVESSKDVGTTFHVFFPITDRPEDPEPREGESSYMPPGSETLLVVDDAGPIRQLVSETLLPLGYRIITASSALEAMALINTEEIAIDLLLTDVVMPGKSGHELAVEARKKRPHLKIIFMSGYTDDRVLHEEIENLESVFIQKPIIPQALSQRIREAFDRG